MRNLLVTQITRGVCPAICIVSVFRVSQDEGYNYTLINGLPMIQAKNDAVELALRKERHLLLIEDDVLINDDVWENVRNMEDGMIGYASTKMRGGVSNVVKTNKGDFIYTGNCFLFVASDVLSEMRKQGEIFEALTWGIDKETGKGEVVGKNDDNLGSDVTFWMKVKELKSKPMICHLGEVDHIRHPMNEIRNYQNPIKLEYW